MKTTMIEQMKQEIRDREAQIETLKEMRRLAALKKLRTNSTRQMALSLNYSRQYLRGVACGMFPMSNQLADKIFSFEDAGIF